ncbi:MAG: PilZ domain-containing protein [Gammaproteobacteria bacterium]
MARRQGILKLNFTDRNRLYMAYMPFVKGGGLFIPTQDEYAMGEEVFVMVTLPDVPAPKGVAAKVVWVTPKGAANPRMRGIGVQISAQDHGALNREIEAIIAPVLHSERPTQTL